MINRSRVLDLAYRLDPRVESGTFHKLTDVDTQTFTDHPLTKLGRRKPVVSQSVGGVGLVDGEAAVFCIWHVELNFAPQTHDKITDAEGVVWSIREVEHRLENTRYHCHCVRLYNE